MTLMTTFKIFFRKKNLHIFQEKVQILKQNDYFCMLLV